MGQRSADDSPSSSFAPGLVGCVLVPATVSRGHVTWIPGSRDFMSGALRPASLSLKNLFALTLLERLVYSLASEVPLFTGMPMEPEEFLKPSRVSGLQPCARIHLKKSLCYSRPVCGMYDKYQSSNRAPRARRRVICFLFQQSLFSPTNQAAERGFCVLTTSRSRRRGIHTAADPAQPTRPIIAAISLKQLF